MLFLPSWYPSEEHPLAGIFIREHARAVALYADVTVIFPVESPQPGHQSSQVSDIIEGALRTILIRYRPGWLDRLTGVRFGWYWHMFKWALRLFRRGYRPDVIHAHVFKAALPAVILGMLLKRPVVVTEHFTGYARGTLSARDRYMARFALNRAAIILTVSASLWRDMEPYGIRNEHRVVPNVIDTERFQLRRSRGMSAGHVPKILFVAFLTPKKGLPVLLHALHELTGRNFHLDVIGDGPNRPEYEQLLERLRLQERVSFLGAISREELPGHVEQCDFLVLPSSVETFGVVLIEALAAGKPVVASDIGGPDEIVTNEVGMLVPSGDVKAWSQAIDYMLDHYQDYAPEKLVAYARSRYTYEIVGRQIQQAYREVLDGRGS
ncbi:MAG: glycosyltransferase [Candidatus Neomarinimicrobiota bacterium]